ncbi:MAG: LVIVD repeat-containing protein [Gemmatirosa sp.]
MRVSAPGSRPLASVARGTLALLATGALVACGSGDGSDPLAVDPPPGTGVGTGTPAAAIAVLGQGVVTDRVTAEVTARGQWVYTSSWGQRFARGNVVYVWDGSGNVPQLVDTLTIANVGTTGDVQVSDDGALLVVATEPGPEGSLVLYGLEDPAHPRFITRYTSPNLRNGVHTAQVSRVNGRLYAFAAVNPGVGAPSRLTIVDLSTPSAPREVWSQTMGQPFVHDTFVRDGLLFTANWDEGMVVWDVGGGARGGSISAPVRMGAVVTRPSDPSQGASVHNLMWLHTDGRRRFVAVGEELTTGATIGNSSAGDVHIVDMNDLANPSSWREVAVYRVPNAGTHNFVADEARGILYIAYYDGGVRALDVRGDLGSCAAAERTTDGRCDLAKMGREIGMALAGSPLTRDPRTNRSSPPFVWGVDLSGDALWASDMLGGLFKLRAISR